LKATKEGIKMKKVISILTITVILSASVMFLASTINEANQLATLNVAVFTVK
jgi:hypothetical protein